jgi:signal transduction histidine kinase
MRFKQVLFNLLSNALKFTYNGSVTIRVTEDAQNDSLLLVSVTDTGVGIPEHI